MSNKPAIRKFVYDYSYWSVAKNDQHFASQEQVTIVLHDSYLYQIQ